MSSLSNYEFWSLALTGVYDILTFLLLLFVAYEALVKPRLPDIAFYPQERPKDTKTWSWGRDVVDFVLENKGVEIRNIKITSEPDDLRWGALRELKEEKDWPKRTSEYFNQIIPSLGHNEKLQFFWCDRAENTEVVRHPFTIIIEFDHPLWNFWRCKKRFKFNFSAFENVAWGLATRFDIHNVAQELTRVREELEKLNKTIDSIANRKNE